MIIDFHTHFYPEKIRARAMASVEGKIVPATDGGRDGLIRSMETNGIDLSVGLPLVNTPHNARGVNAWAATEDRGPVRMLGSLHPEDPDWRGSLAYIVDHGFPGIKLHPEYQLFEFSDERFFPIWEACEKAGLFLLTHAGFDINFPAPYKTDPEKLARFHRRFPGLRLVLAHLGSMSMWDDVEKYLVGLPVWFDTAMIDETWIRPEQLLRIIRGHGADRILFGTDSPWMDQAKPLALLRNLPLAQEELDAILGGNAARLLRLKEKDADSGPNQEKTAGRM